MPAAATDKVDLDISCPGDNAQVGQNVCVTGTFSGGSGYPFDIKCRMYYPPNVPNPDYCQEQKANINFDQGTWEANFSGVAVGTNYTIVAAVAPPTLAAGEQRGADPEPGGDRRDETVPSPTPIPYVLPVIGVNVVTNAAAPIKVTSAALTDPPPTLLNGKTQDGNKNKLVLNVIGTYDTKYTMADGYYIDVMLTLDGLHLGGGGRLVTMEGGKWEYQLNVPKRKWLSQLRDCPHDPSAMAQVLMWKVNAAENKNDPAVTADTKNPVMVAVERVYITPAE